MLQTSAHIAESKCPFSLRITCFLLITHFLIICGGLHGDDDGDYNRTLSGKGVGDGEVGDFGGRGVNCWKGGAIYQPNPSTICRCTGFLSAKCTPIGGEGGGGNNGVHPPPHSSSPFNPSPHPRPVGFHPLDPLSPEEIHRTRILILRSQSPEFSSILKFNTISMKEPPKCELLPYFLANTIPPTEGSGISRKSISILWDTRHGLVYEAVVNLDNDVLESWVEMPAHNRVPLLSPEDDRNVNVAVLAHPGVRDRCRDLGLTDMSLIYTATWILANIFDSPYQHLRRPYQVFLYSQNFKDDNAYAHPLPFVVIVDIVGPDGKPGVVAIENLPTHGTFDNGQNTEGNTVPRTTANYDYKLRPPNFLRRDDKPIHCSSPQGPSYRVTGNLVEWQKYKFRIGFNAREGLTLHNIVYQDNGRIRPIIYRASVTEIGAVYGDPRPPFHRKNGFDEGNIGLGWRANELSNPGDCLGSTTFINGTSNNNQGQPLIFTNAICITEEDAGMLWKHVDDRSGKTRTVRSHRLVLTLTSTVGNYDLSFNWMFYQDASIQFRLKLTGIVNTNMMAVDGSSGGFGTIMMPQVMAAYHQHLIGLRLDTEIDGNDNSIEMVDMVPLPSGTGSFSNPYGQGFTVRSTPLRTQAEGCSMINPSSGRVWAITNPNVIHPVTGSPVAWVLKPWMDAELMIQGDSPVIKQRLEFLACDVWVTKYQEDQIYAAGTYFNNSGLPEWVGRDPGCGTVNTDLVIWHMFRMTHIPRIEDFPVMPVVHADVWFMPKNFFLENPSLDVPPTMGGRGGRNNNEL